ncbi:MAG: FecR domain-containing protein [Elusimicrobiota bacterium]
MKSITLSLCTLCALLLSSGGASAALTRIGAAGGVSGQVLALAPQATDARVMKSGKVVYSKDRVTTDARGRMQVMLLDQTVFTLGPNTEIVLDDFVYDPVNTSANKVSARVSKGVFRFVTGKIARQKPSSMKVKLPVGTIGIRGTIAAGRTDGKTATVALLGPGGQNNAGEKAGAISVSNAGVTVEITRPGYGTDIGGPGIPPTPPFKLSNEQLSSLDVAPKAEAGGGEGDEPAAGGKSATEESGQDTAAAQGDLTETGSTGELASSVSDVSNEAAQEAAQTSASDGDAQWTDIRTIPTGSGYFSGSGNYTCTGGSGCSSGGSGSFSSYVDVSFTNNTITNVSFSLSGTITASTSLSGGPIPFGSSGVATQTFNGSQVGDFANTSVTFLNSGGSVGNQMRFDMQYSGVAGTLDSGATAVGNYTASGG